MKAQPIQERERIVVLDIIRGLAIFGILLVNMPTFFAPFLYIEPRKYWSSTIDLWSYNFVDIVAQASFYTLFSFLFGYGFVIFTKRLEEKQLSVPKYFSRRLVVLLLIGIFHAFIIWHGDILITYAIIGFLLLLLRNLSSKTMVWTGILLLVIPNALISLLLLVTVSLGLTDGVYEEFQIFAAQSLEVYSSGTFLDITMQRIADWSFANVNAFIFIIFSILPMFLFGAALAKAKWLENMEENTGAFKKLWVISVVGTLIFKLLPYYSTINEFTEYVQDIFGGPFHALFYFTSVVLLARNKTWLKLLSPLRYVGRMSLSNYLFQSIICTTIFYSYGFGLYGQITFTTGFIVCFLLFVIQIFISKWWVNRFYYGPVEWLWRIGTYGRKQPFRR